MCQCVCVMCVFNAQVHVCLWVQCRSPKGCCSTRRQLLFPVQIVKKNVIENVVPIIVATKHLVSTCTVYYTQSILYCTVYCAQSILYCTVYCAQSILYCTVYCAQSILYCIVYCAQSILYCTVYCASSLSSIHTYI